jgi:hypothetical protein
MPGPNKATSFCSKNAMKTPANSSQLCLTGIHLRTPSTHATTIDSMNECLQKSMHLRFSPKTVAAAFCSNKFNLLLCKNLSMHIGEESLASEQDVDGEN